MQDVIQLLSDYGWGVGILMIIGYVLWVYFKHKIPSLFSDRASDNHLSNIDQSIRLDNSANLSYHSFFANAQYRLNVEVPNLDLLPNKPVKQQMFRDILGIYIRNLYKTCKDISDLDMNDWSPEKWCDEITRKLNSNMSEFISACLSHGVPEIVMTKFFKWHQPTQEILFEGVMSLGNSTIFNSNVIRTNTLFFILNLLLVTTIADSEKTLKELNGEIHGKIYNGQTIEE